MIKVQIVFMGTPDFAVPTLKSLIENKHNVLSVITQPDRPFGRKRIKTAPPVKKFALEHNIPVLQPESVKNEDFIDTIRELKPDLFVVAAFGQILPRALLDIPFFGAINVHASLLPKYRGAAPIQWAIINGEEYTGVTTMWMDEGMDTGDIFLSDSIKIQMDWTSEDLSRELSMLGADLIIETIEYIEGNSIIRLPQEEEHATYAPILKKQDGKINWNKNTLEIHNLIRGLNPWPYAYTIKDSNEIKLIRSKIYKTGGEGNPGKFMGIVKDEGFLVGTADGCLLIQELHEAGKRRMTALDYLKGHPLKEGEYFADA